MQVVYLDVYFMLNWWMNLLLLAVTGLFSRECPRLWRWVLAAAVGAAGACIVLVLPRGAQLLALLPLLVAVNRVAFPSLNCRRLLRRSAIYLAGAMTLGAVLDWWYFQVLGKSPRLGGLVALAGVLAVALMAGILYEREHGRKQAECFKVLLYVGESHLITQGFLDSGNLLTDAMGRPVHILEEGFLYEQCPQIEEHIRSGEVEAFELGYKSLGGDGVLRVIAGSRLMVPELGVDQEHPLVGLSDRALFSEGGCHMLINGKMKKPCT